jgi:magnesium transporter
MSGPRVGQDEGVTATRCYRDGKLVAEGFPVAEVSEYLAGPGATVWFDMCAPEPADLAAISEELGLHPLAVEDAVQPHQRPKLDHYRSHLFMTAYAARLDSATGEVALDEVAAFITANALVTVRKSEAFDIAGMMSRWDDAGPDLAAAGVSFLVHGLLDYIVDSQFDAIQALDGDVEELEDALFGDDMRDVTVQRRTYELRKSLVKLRRVVLPMREVVNTLLRRDLHVIDPETMPYFQDVYDHVLRAGEWTESLRDLITNIYDTHLTLRGNRLNVVMKQVTSWAAIIAVPTAVTGFYGQNVPYPGFGHLVGFWTSTLVTVGMSAMLYLLFKRKGWL